MTRGRGQWPGVTRKKWVQKTCVSFEEECKRLHGQFILLDHFLQNIDLFMKYLVLCIIWCHEVVTPYFSGASLQTLIMTWPVSSIEAIVCLNQAWALLGNFAVNIILEWDPWDACNMSCSSATVYDVLSLFLLLSQANPLPTALNVCWVQIPIRCRTPEEYAFINSI